MVYTVSVTSQGQISIPVPLRRKYGLDKIKRAIVVDKGDRIEIEPIKDFLDLGGSLRTNKRPLSNKELHDMVAQASADDYADKLKRIQKREEKK